MAAVTGPEATEVREAPNCSRRPWPLHAFPCLGNWAEMQATANQKAPHRHPHFSEGTEAGLREYRCNKRRALQVMPQFTRVLSAVCTTKMHQSQK